MHFPCSSVSPSSDLLASLPPHGGPPLLLPPPLFVTLLLLQCPWSLPALPLQLSLVKEADLL